MKAEAILTFASRATAALTPRAFRPATLLLLFSACTTVTLCAALGGIASAQILEDVSNLPAGPDAIGRGGYDDPSTVAISSRPGLRFARGVLIVQLADGLEPRIGADGGLSTGHGELDGFLKASGLVRAERLFPWDCERKSGGECNVIRLNFTYNTDIESVMNALATVPGVERVEPAGVHRVQFYPDDQFFYVQWGLNQIFDHDVNAPEAWDVEKGDSSIIVAVVDTGVDWLHPDLGGAPPYTGGNIWTNWPEFYGSPGVDDDGNGFVDDVRGWDFVDGLSLDPYIFLCGGEDGEDQDNDPSDYFGHGTHVAGIVAALTDNSIGVAGLANGCKIMPVRVGWCNSDGSGSVRTDFCAQGLMYAARNGARVINCSWNSDSGLNSFGAVDTAIARGVVLAVSAGNEGTSFQTYNYLSTRADCFAVAAVDSFDVKPYFSNFGAWVDFSAPGVVVASTYFDRRNGSHTYAYMTGTSMAAPFVCALSALLLSKEPSLTREGVRSIMSSTCDPIDALNPSYVGQLGAGRVNAYAALSLGSGNWQKKTAGEVVASPLPVRIGFSNYVAVTSSDGCLYVVNSLGNPASGWPKCVSGSPTSPAAGDVDGDGEIEFVAGTDAGNLYVWNANGSTTSGWPVSLGAGVTSGPMLCDLDGDGELEIVCGTVDSRLYVMRADGSVQSGWPVDFTGYLTSDPCFASVGEETTSVVLVGTSDSRLHALESDGTESSDWPVTLGMGMVRSSVAVDVDLDGRSELFVGDSDGYVYGLDDDGGLLGGWPRAASGSLTRSLALADMDADSIPELVGATSSGRIHAWKLTGQPLTGWPVQTGGAIVSSPSLVDLDGDGRCEVAVGSDDRDLHIWSPSGAPFSGWPRSTGGVVRSSPCFYDVDRDDKLELSVGSGDGKLHFWQLTGPDVEDAVTDWPMYRHDAHRTGNSGIAVAMPSLPPKSILAVTGYPNPFVGGVTFLCTLANSTSGGSSGRRGEISIFDVAGRKVAEIPVYGSGDVLSINWGGGNEASRMLASGVYVYEAEIDGLKANGKLVFFKQ